MKGKKRKLNLLVMKESSQQVQVWLSKQREADREGRVKTRHVKPREERILEEREKSIRTRGNAETSKIRCSLFL